MEIIKNRMELENKIIYPETSADCVKYGNSDLENFLDNYSPFPTSDFAKKILACNSMAEICRLLHLDYSFAKDIIDNVYWTINGAPAIDNGALHATQNNYIYRIFKLGAYDTVAEFDISCSDTSKVAFQFFDNTASTSLQNYQHFVRLDTDSDGGLHAKYQYRRCTSSTTWGTLTTAADIELGDFSTTKHVKITFTKDGGDWSIFVDNKFIDNFIYAMATQNWRVYLGNTADCLIDNFSLTYNGTVISELDFD